MPDKIYFRVDVRSFAPGDIVSPGRQFIANHKPKGTAMEEVLRSTAPSDMPPRDDQLFLFEDDECARYHLIKTAGGRLYHVTIEDDIIHRGDMHILDEIGETQDEAERTQLGDRYWRGEPTDDPCIEVLVPKARVVEEIILSAEERRDIWAANGVPRPKFEKESIEDLIAKGLDEYG